MCTKYMHVAVADAERQYFAYLTLIMLFIGISTFCVCMKWHMTISVHMVLNTALEFCIVTQNKTCNPT